MQKIRAREAIRREEIKKIRQVLARDFHDEMGNKLAGITVLTSSLDILLTNKSKKVQEVLSSLEYTSKELFTGTKSFIWSMDPESDNLKEIIAYIQHFGVDLLKNSGINFNVEPKIDHLPSTIHLPMGSSRQIYFIFKEAITNALVHSKASNLTLSCRFQETKNAYTVRLSDDGKGLEEKRSFGKGLHNMVARAEKINCQLSYFNNKEGGFIVEFIGTLPIS